MNNRTRLDIRMFIKITALLTCIVVLYACAGLSEKESKGTDLYLPVNESEVPRISSEDLKARLDRKEEILVVDVRSVDQFNELHIAGAVSVPFSEIMQRLDDLPVDKHIVFY